MIRIKDQIGREQECFYIIETPVFQPVTNEVFYTIMSVGYDGIRRSTLFNFRTEKEMHEKYKELYTEYMKQFILEHKN